MKIKKTLSWIMVLHKTKKTNGARITVLVNWLQNIALCRLAKAEQISEQGRNEALNLKLAFLAMKQIAKTVKDCYAWFCPPWTNLQDKKNKVRACIRKREKEKICRTMKNLLSVAAIIYLYHNMLGAVL